MVLRFINAGYLNALLVGMCIGLSIALGDGLIYGLSDGLTYGVTTAALVELSNTIVERETNRNMFDLSGQR